MGKLKSKSCLAKRIKITGTGKILCFYANKRHNMRSKNSRMLKQKVGSRLMSDTETSAISKGVNRNACY